MYGKIVNGNLEYSPRVVNIGNTIVCNPTAEQLLSIGYKPIRLTEAPEAPEGKIYVFGYEDKGEYIEQIWTLTDKPVTLEDKVKSLEEQNAMLTECLLEMSMLVYQ